MAQAAIPVISTVASAALQRKGAKDAGKALKAGADESSQVQREALQQMRIATEPFRFGGQQSINPLLQLLGISGINLPNQPSFNLLSGAPQNDRRTEIEARLAELRQQRGQ